MIKTKKRKVRVATLLIYPPKFRVTDASTLDPISRPFPTRESAESYAKVQGWEVL